MTSPLDSKVANLPNFPHGSFLPMAIQLLEPWVCYDRLSLSTSLTSWLARLLWLCILLLNQLAPLGSLSTRPAGLSSPGALVCPSALVYVDRQNRNGGIWIKIIEIGNIDPYGYMD